MVEKLWPAVAGAIEEVVMEGSETIWIDKDCVPPMLSESVARAAKLYEPTVVGVPEMAPVDEFKLNPVGRDPLDMLQVREPVPPEPDRVCE